MNFVGGLSMIEKPKRGKPKMGIQRTIRVNLDGSANAALERVMRSRRWPISIAVREMLVYAATKGMR